MFRPLALFLGLRYTRAERSNRFISFISLISMVGLTLGVAILITVLSVMNGFDRELKSRILGMVPQATVTATQIIQTGSRWRKVLPKTLRWKRWRRLFSCKVCSPPMGKWRVLW